MKGLYIGLMSGTSMDGVDAALAEIDDEQTLLQDSFSLPIPGSLYTSLATLCAGNADHEIELMAETDRLIGQLFAEAAQGLLDKNGLQASNIVAIGSHGQTIRHAPDNKPGWTIQIGDPNTIAEQTGITTVADFRRRDIAAGGQGAPLVPAFHEAVFRSDTQDRVILNIGGMANITILSADRSPPVTGFDTGPGNVLIDEWIQLCEHRDYDDKGHWGAGGNCNETLLKLFLEDNYFHQLPPKSTGRETFNIAWLHEFTRRQQYRNIDIQATLTELTAVSIADAVKQYAAATGEILVCGGGAHNDYLLARLAANLPGIRIESSALHGLDPDWVEAVAFAWLAKQTLEKKTGNLPGVTGAAGPRVLGGIYYA
jgi:anhydro-N-acetylmuramic acid kinase